MIEEGIQKYYKPREWIHKIHFYNTIENKNSIRFIQNYVHKHYSTIHDFGWNNLCQSKKIDLLNIVNKYFTYLSPHSINRLCENKLAIYIIEKHLDKLLPENWNSLCVNCNAIHIIENNLDKISSYGWTRLCTNPNAIHILEKNLDKINTRDKWKNICINPNAYNIIINNKKNIEIGYIVRNTNPKIFNLCFDKECLDIYYQNSNNYIKMMWKMLRQKRFNNDINICIIKFNERSSLN